MWDLVCFVFDDEIEKMGIKILKQYATLGPFDFINIVEAPNNDAISKLSIELTSRGTIQIESIADSNPRLIYSLLKKPFGRVVFLYAYNR